MGFNLFSKFKKNKDEKDTKDVKKETKSKEKVQQIDLINSKYPNEICAVCNQKGCDKKWGGQYWHKKCLRAAKSMAKGMM